MPTTPPLSACPVCDAPVRAWERRAHIFACTVLLHAEIVARESAAAARKRLFGRRAVEFESEDGSISFESD